MNKITIGILFILAGLVYGSLAFEKVYNLTLGYLIENNWISPPVQGQTEPNMFGRKATIILYSLGLIVIGIFLLWNHNN